MSGGSYDYIYSRIDDAADSIEARHFGSPLHTAFAAHLRQCSKAMHDIEWVDSGDYSPGDEAESIIEVLGGRGGLNSSAVEQTAKLLRNTVERLEDLLKTERSHQQGKTIGSS